MVRMVTRWRPHVALRLRKVMVAVALQPRQWVKQLGRYLPEVASQTVTILTLDNQWLKLLQVTGPFRTRRISKVLAMPVEGRKPEELSQLLKDLCATEGAPAGEAFVAIPTHLCTIRLFSLPSIDQKEIRDIVELQAEKHTPYAKDEIVTDFLIMHRDASGYSRILLVIVHQDVVARIVQLVESSGLMLDRVGCEVEGLLQWVQMARKSGSSSTSGRALVVDIDGSTTTVLVVDRTQLLFHRSLATGAEQLHDDPAQAGARLLSELQRSLEALELEGTGAKIQEVWLTGRMEQLGNFKGLLEQGLHVPVHLVSPWLEQPMSEGVKVALERLPNVSFAGLVGLAMVSSTIDVTPQAAKLRHAFEAKAKALVSLGCQGIGALVLIAFLLIGRAQKEQWYYRALSKVYQRSAQEAEQVESAIHQVGLVKEQLRHRGQLLAAVQALASRTAPEIRWDSIAFTEGEGVILKGTSTELPKVYEFVAALDAEPLFGQVQARRVSKRKGEEEELTDFEIVCPFKS